MELINLNKKKNNRIIIVQLYKIQLQINIQTGNNIHN